MIGNPTRAHGGMYPAMPQTQYQVVDVVRQYDPVADFPADPFNLLAMLNIGAGILSSVHLDYTDVALDDPRNTVWTEGNITYVFVPTQNLPLLTPLRLFGLGWLADELNEPLKEIVERAYDRPYLAEAEPLDPPAEPAPRPCARTRTRRRPGSREPRRDPRRDHGHDRRHAGAVARRRRRTRHHGTRSGGQPTRRCPGRD